MTPASADDRARVEALYELYVYDFSEFLGLDVAEDGRFHGPSIASFFTELDRHALLFRADGLIVGFALVVESSRLTGEPGVCDVAEFFVLRRHRRSGIGEQAARWMFDRFPGRWEVRQKTENPTATAFWRRVIGRYTSDRFEEIELDDDRWRGPVQRFDTRRR